MEDENNRNSILMVSENGHLDENLISILKQKKFQIETSQDVDTLPKKIKELNPFLVLIYVNNPVSESFDIGRKIRFAPEVKDVPIMFVKDKNEPADKEKYRLSDADDYYLIPLNKRDFLSFIERVLTDKDFAERILLKDKLRIFLEIVGITIHEINQPLTAILCNSEMILRAISGDESTTKRRVENIHNNVINVIDTTQGLQMLKRNEIHTMQKEIYVLDF